MECGGNIKDLLHARLHLSIYFYSKHFTNVNIDTSPATIFSAESTMAY